MSELITVTANSVTPQAFEFDVNSVKEQVDKYSTLTINGIEDKAGAKAVKDARIELKKIRTGIEKKRTELKAGALEFGRRVDAVAKELTAIVEPTEKLLESREAEVAQEIDRLATIKLNDRVEKLNAVRCTLPPIDVLRKLSDEAFDSMLVDATNANNERLRQEEEDRKEEEERKAKEAEEKRIEAERRAKELKEFEEAREMQRQEQERIDAQRREMQQEIQRQQEAIEAERRKVEAERAAIEAEKAEQARIAREAVEARERAKQAERDRIEADARKAKEESDRIERERIAQEIAERQAAEHAAHLEKMKPVRQKLMEYHDAIYNYPIPDVDEQIANTITTLVEDFTTVLLGVIDNICGENTPPSSF